MKWIAWQNLFALALALITMMPSVVRAQFAPPDDGPPKALNEEDRKQLERVNKAFDEIDQEIEKLEAMAEAGGTVVDKYQAELEQEFRENHQTLQQVDDRGLERSQIEQLIVRQNTISLHLWELERLRPQIASGSIGRNDLNMRLHRILSDHRIAQKHPEIMERYQQLNRRINDMSRNQRRIQMRLRHGNVNGFFIVEPVRSETPTLISEFENGPIQELIRPLRRMLRLSWSGGSLRWDAQHWDAFFNGKNLTTIAEEVRTQLKRRGLEIPVSEEGSPFAYQPYNESPNVQLLFQNLAHRAGEAAGATTGTSGGGGGRQWQQRFTTERLVGELSIRDQDIDLRLEELIGPERRFEIAYSRRKGLLITLRGADHTLLFDQLVDGRVRLMELYKDEKIAVTADSFAKLYAQYPDLIEISFFPLLAHFGAELPPNRFDPKVVQCVLEKLHVEHPAATDEFRKLLAELDSPSYDVRDLAAKRLSQLAPVHIERMTAAYKNEPLSLETRTRLKQIIQAYEHTASELDAIVTEMELTHDTQYLVAALSRSVPGPQQERLAVHLEQLSGQSFGVDVDRWNAWLAAQPRSRGEE